MRVAWPAVALLALEAARVSPLPLTALLALLGVATILGLLRVAKTRDAGFVRRFVLVSAAAGVVAALPALLPWGEGPRLYELGHAMAPLLAVASLTPWLPWNDPGPATDAPLVSTRTMLGTCATSVVLVIAFQRWYVGPEAVIADEGGYLLQAGWLSHGWAGWRIPEGTREFFINRHVVERDGVLYGQYPPGWPAIVAVMSRLGLRGVTGAAMAVVTLGVTWSAARRVAGEAVARVAVVILASSVWFVGMGASWMSHLPGMMAVTGATAMLLVAEESSGWRRRLAWTGAGALLGVAFLVRPLTALALTLSIVAWRWLVSPATRGTALQQAAWMSVGGVPFGVLMMVANQALSGSPFTFGYTAVHGALHDLGFGPRGFLLYDEQLHRVPSTIDFSPARAVASFMVRGRDFLYSFLPLFVAVPLFVALRPPARSAMWRQVLPFLGLPAAYLFYWSADTRFHVELLPFVAIGVAWLLVDLGRERRPLALALLLVVATGGWSTLLRGSGNAGRGAYAETPWRHYQPVGETRPLRASMDSLRAAHPRVLVFSRDSTSLFDAQLARLMTYNGDGDTGPILVARDRGEANAGLQARYPERVAVLVVRSKDGTRHRVVPLPARGTGGAS